MTNSNKKESLEQDDEEFKKYWGPLIGAGGNGPAAKPLFTSFKTEGHVSTTCLWHACRAVTVGSLLIVMGITMAVLGKNTKETPNEKVSNCQR